MLTTELIVEWVDDLERKVRRRIEGLSVEQLAWRPDPGANPISATVWHFSRWLDLMTVCALQGRPQDQQLWFTLGWVARTGYDPRGLGEHGYGTMTGYTLEEVGGIPVLSADDLLEYLGQGSTALRTYLRSLDPDTRRAPAAGDVLPEPDRPRPTAAGKITPPFRGPDESISRLEWLTIILTGSLCHVGEIDAFNHMRARLRGSVAAGATP